MNILRKSIFVIAALAFASPAFAADMPTKAVYQPVAAPLFDWSGFYAGIDAGGAFGSADSSINVLNVIKATSDTSPNGGVFGGHIGAQKQYGNIVLGVQATLFGGSINDSSPVSATFNGRSLGNTGISKSDKFDFIALGEFKAGYAIYNVPFFNNLLPYLTVGIADARSSTSLNAPGFGVTSQKVDNFGWTIGAGLSWAVTQLPGWIVDVNYRYIDLGTVHSAYDLGPVGLVGASAGYDVNQKINLITAGLSYKF